jgi:hypothetical protein
MVAGRGLDRGGALGERAWGLAGIHQNGLAPSLGARGAVT